MDPWEAYNRRPRPEAGVQWPSRLEALMIAFAEEAGERERDVLTVMEAFGEMTGGDD